MFSLTVKKPSGLDLWCKFGYLTSNGEILIFDSTTPTFPSASQTLVTKLDRVEPRDLQTLFTNCYDSTSAYARDEENVTVTASLSILTKSLKNLGSLLKKVESPIITTSSIRPFEFTDILATFSNIKAANSSTQQASKIDHFCTQVKMTAFDFKPSEVTVLTQILGEIV